MGLTEMFEYRSRKQMLLIACIWSAIGGVVTTHGLFSRGVDVSGYTYLQIVTGGLLSIVGVRLLLSVLSGRAIGCSCDAETIEWSALWPLPRTQRLKIADVTHILVESDGVEETLVVKLRNDKLHTIPHQCFGSNAKHLLAHLEVVAPSVCVLHERNWLHAGQIKEHFRKSGS